MSRASVPITVRGVTKTYGDVFALDAVDLDVGKGEFLTLLGPSGSGKTTLLMVLAGFIRPDRGSVKFGDDEVVRRPPHQRDVGMVFQNYALFPHMDVAANIAYPLRLRRVPAAECVRRVEGALELVQLAGYGARPIDALSGGQRQRVALARAIVFEPRIVLMDEPLSALDKQLRERMQIELRQLHERLGATTVYVTHDQREALTMSDRIAVIHAGRIAQLGTPREIYDRPASRFVAEFIGESSFLPVTRSDTHLVCCDVPLRVPRAPDGQCVVVMVRPERLRLLGAGDSAVEPATGEPLNVFGATVEQLVYQGDSVLVQAVLGDGSRLAARATTLDPQTASLRPGAGVRLGLRAEDTVLVADD